MIVADVSFIDIFWSMLWFFFLLIWIMILVHILGDLFRDHDLSGATKTLWVVFLVFLPFLAVLIYLFTRGKGMAERAAVRQQQAQDQFEGYVRTVASSGDAACSPGRADRPGQAAAGCGHHRPGRVRPPEGQSPRLTPAPYGRRSPAARAQNIGLPPSAG